VAARKLPERDFRQPEKLLDWPFILSLVSEWAEKSARIRF